MSGANIVRKITPETVLRPDQRKRPDSSSEWLYRIAGVVTGYEVGTSNFGEYTELQGEFQALRFVDGEVFTAGSAFLPAGMAELIARKLADGVNKETGERSRAEILLDIGVKPSKREPDNPLKYEYIVRSPRDDAKDSPVRKLLQAYEMPALPPGKLFDKTA